MRSSAEAVLEELQATFAFMSEFLAGLGPDTRRALAAVAHLESYKTDQVIHDVGDDATHFSVILSGRVDVCSHPPGATRPKSVVSVLRRGDALGDQAIINGQPHSTAACPASNTTLLVVARPDFLAVLGPHFQDASAGWQRLLCNVAPMSDMEPEAVRRLCATLVHSKPAAGQECNLHEEQVCFIKAGTFELRLIDLEAQQAAEAALAAAVASASSALQIAPLPPSLMHGRCRRTPAGRRPSSAPAAAVGRARTTAPPAAVGLALPAAPASAAAAAQPAGAGSSSARGLAACSRGCGLLDDGLSGLPALGTEGVLAGVRVQHGRLLGTQGLERQLRKQHSAHVPYKLLATLGVGDWFGGGAAVYGAGSLQAALRVVAVGHSCEVVHAHLAGLQQHGGPALMKRLRDDAAFTLSYHLGRLGVLPLGAAVGHPQSVLVSTAAAGAAAGASADALACAGNAQGTTCAADAQTAVSRPASAARGAHRAARLSAALDGGRRGSGSDSDSSSCSSSGSGSSSICQPDAVEGDSVEAARPAACGAAAAAAAAESGSCIAAAGLPRTPVRRQKQAHVPGVFSAGAMAALQHVRSLQAEHGRLVHRAQDSSTGGGICSSVSSSTQHRANAAAAAAAAAAAECSTWPAAGCCSPAARGRTFSGAVTAADAYFQQPDHSRTATGHALSSLLTNIFKDGLQPLVTELDGLLGCAAVDQQVQHVDVAQQHWQPGSPWQHAATGAGRQLQQQQPPWSPPALLQASTRPKTAAGRLQACAVAERAPWQAPACGGKAGWGAAPSTAAADAGVLEHRPGASLLAASIMWQRSSAACFRPPLRQVLTSSEISQQHAYCAP